MAFFGVELKSTLPTKLIENPQHIGEHIRNRRLQLKLLQSDLAKLFDVCEDSITGWENGRCVPKIQFYPKLIQFLGYNPLLIDNNTLGGRIKNFRIEHGLSPKAFGKLVSADASTVRAWEENVHQPATSKMRKLKELLNSKEPF